MVEPMRIDDGFADIDQGCEVTHKHQDLGEGSVLFGRFALDTLSWEKWSVFSENKYLEEVDKCSTPGSVAKKAALFDAHYKKIIPVKTHQLNEEGRCQEENMGSIAADKGNEDGNNMDSIMENGNDFDISLRKDEHVDDLNNNSDSMTKRADYEEISSPLDGSQEENTAELVASSVKVIMPSPKEEDVQIEESKLKDEDVQTEESKFNRIVKEVSSENPEGNSNTCNVTETVDGQNVQETGNNQNIEETRDVQTLQEGKLEKKKSTKSVKTGIAKSKQGKIGLMMPSEKKGNTQKPKMKNMELKTKSAKNGASKIPKSNARVRNLSKPYQDSEKEVKSDKEETIEMEADPKMKETTHRDANPKMKPETSSLQTTKSQGAQKVNITIPQPFSLATGKRPSIIENLADKEIVRRAFKAFQHSLSLSLSTKSDVSVSFSKQTPKSEAAKPAHKPRTSIQNQRNSDQNREKSKKSIEQKKEVNKSLSDEKSGKNSNTKAVFTTFSLKSDERAEKRKQFYMQLEEKMNAKEAEKNQIQEKTKEEMEAEIKKFRRSLNFRASPMPNFYQESPPPKKEVKKLPLTRAKSPKLGRRNVSSNPSLDGDSIQSSGSFLHHDINKGKLNDRSVNSNQTTELTSQPLSSQIIKKDTKLESTSKHKTENAYKTKLSNKSPQEVNGLANIDNSSFKDSYKRADSKTMQEIIPAQEIGEKEAKLPKHGQISSTESSFVSNSMDKVDNGKQGQKPTHKIDKVGETEQADMVKKRKESLGKKVVERGTFRSEVKVKSIKHPTSSSNPDSGPKSVKQLNKEQNSIRQQESLNNVSMTDTTSDALELTPIIADVAVTS